MPVPLELHQLFNFKGLAWSLASGRVPTIAKCSSRATTLHTGRTEPDIARARNLFFSPFKEEEGERARRGVGEGNDRGVL